MNHNYRVPRFTVAMAQDSAIDCDVLAKRRLGARDAGTHEGAVKAAETRRSHGEMAQYHTEQQAYHEKEAKARGESAGTPGKGSHAAAASQHSSAAFYHQKANENPGDAEYEKKSVYHTKLADSASKNIAKQGENYNAPKKNDYLENKPTMTSQQHSAKRIARHLKENRIRMR
jgi:hypothetical protein